jgi:hypothetical protein
MDAVAVQIRQAGAQVNAAASMLRRRIDATMAFSGEGLRSDLIRGSTPVRARKMRRDKRPDSGFDFNQNRGSGDGVDKSEKYGHPLD